MSKLAQYRSWTSEDAAAEADAQGGPRAEWLKFPPDSKKRIRILPNPTGGSPFRVVWKHAYTDPATGQFVAFACPRAHGGAHCPACTESASLKRSPHKDDQDQSWQMAAKKRVLVTVLDREDGLVKVWEFGAPMGAPKGKTMYEKLLALRADEDVGADYTDPTGAGYDLVIKRTGSGQKNTTYDAYLDRAPSPLHIDDDAAVAIIEGQPDLAPYMTPPTPEALAAKLGGAHDAAPAPAVLPAAREVARPRSAMDYAGAEDEELPF